MTGYYKGVAYKLSSLTREDRGNCPKLRQKRANEFGETQEWVLFFFFSPRHTACRILVPYPGIEPVPLQWRCGVLTTGPPGKSQEWVLDRTWLRWGTLQERNSTESFSPKQPICLDYKKVLIRATEVELRPRTFSSPFLWYFNCWFTNVIRLY